MIGVLLAKPTEAVAQRLSGIDEATSRMTMLIDRFLDTERQEDSVVEVTRVDFDALLGEVERHFDHIGCSDRLVFVVERPLPEYWGDADMLLSVLVNLIDNALKYSADDQEVETELEVTHGALRIRSPTRVSGSPNRTFPILAGASSVPPTPRPPPGLGSASTCAAACSSTTTGH